ncbi:MAG: hypothetical protein CME69_09885 [Halobacteriovorax sp.]|nr:hypothetical protein [Halobacteriovorax sp.]
MHVRKILVSFISLLFLSNVIAQNKVTPIEMLGGLTLIEHKTCNIYYEKVSPKYLSSDLKKMLNEKGYQLSQYKKGDRLEPGDFRIVTKHRLEGSGYKKCFFEMAIYRLISKYPNEKDHLVMRKSSTRKFPRQTFEGKERCKLALKDMTYSINPCNKID